MCDRRDSSEQQPGIVPQYEALRRAALGNVLPAEGRSGLMLFLRRGMWAWAHVASATLIGAQEPAASRLSTGEGPRTAIHIFAAMAMNAERRGVRL